VCVCVCVCVCVKQLSYKEFHMFIIACIDRQVELEGLVKEDHKLPQYMMKQDWCSIQ